MDVTMKALPPKFVEDTSYGKKNTKKIKEQHKKTGLFRVRVKGMNLEESRNVVHELRQSLYRPSGYIGLQCLSEVEWGQPAEYDAINKIYVDFICIPKDFDNPEAQLEAILKKAKEKMYEIKKAHNKRLNCVAPNML